MKKFTALAAGAVLALSATMAHAQSKDYVLNTASTGGTYHPVGTAISTLSKVKLLPKTEIQPDRRELGRFGRECAGAGCRHG